MAVLTFCTSLRLVLSACQPQAASVQQAPTFCSELTGAQSFIGLCWLLCGCSSSKSMGGTATGLADKLRATLSWRGTNGSAAAAADNAEWV